MGDPTHQIHDPGNHRTFKRYYHRQLARNGRLITQPRLLRMPLLHHAAGHDPHLLYLPPYSPDFNPIEMASKFKALIRASEPGTLEDLRKAVANAIEKFIPTECKNFFDKAGYQSI